MMTDGIMEDEARMPRVSTPLERLILQVEALERRVAALEERVLNNASAEGISRSLAGRPNV